MRRTIRIKRDDGRYLADDIVIRWTSDLSEAAEYDSEAGALQDVEGEGLSDCDIVTEED